MQAFRVQHGLLQLPDPRADCTQNEVIPKHGESSTLCWACAKKKRLKAIALKSEIVVLMQMIQEFSVPIRKNPVYPHKNKSDLPTDLPSSET